MDCQILGRKGQALKRKGLDVIRLMNVVAYCGSTNYGGYSRLVEESSEKKSRTDEEHLMLGVSDINESGCTREMVQLSWSH